MTDQPDSQPLIVGPPGPPATPPPGSPERESILESFISAARELVARLRQRDEELARLLQITERVNYGVVLEDVLDFIYREMRQVIPYNRIGFSLLDEQGMVTARWARSDRAMLLTGGYQAALEGSTLKQIIESGRPRIINDLQAYLASKPASNSTALIVREGMRSSLTCPLVVQGRPIGFIFFSSDQKDTYSNVHVDFFQQIAGQLAAIVEKSRLYTALSEQNRTIEHQNKLMRADLEMARHVQRALIPQAAPVMDGLEVAFEYEPATQVGGDFLDIVPLPGGEVLFLVADAVGHGVQAALVVSAIKTALHSAVEADAEPSAVLCRLNGMVAGLFSEKFVTAVCMLWSRGGLSMSLAGHPHPLWRHGPGEVTEVGEGGLPLGVDDKGQYQSTPVRLAAGDMLVVYTDGIVEAFDGAGREYGLERLRALVSAGGDSAGELVRRIRDDLAAHCGGQPTADDVTLLVIKNN